MRLRALAGILAVTACAANGSTSVPAQRTATAPPTAGAAYLDAYRSAAPASVGARPDRATGTIASIDDQLGSPRFVWARPDAAPPASPTAHPLAKQLGATSPAAAAAIAYVEANAAAYALGPDALATLVVTQIHDLGRGGIVVRLGQRVDGLEVYRSQLSVIMRRDLSLVAIAGNLHPKAHAGLASAFQLAPADAVTLAATDVRGIAPMIALPAGARGGVQRIAADGLLRPATARPVLFPLPDRLVLAWVTEVAWRDGARIRDYRHVIADDDGRVLFRGDLVASSFAYTVWADPTDTRPLEGPTADATPHPTGSPDGFLPAFIAPVSITIDGLNHAPGGGHDPWLPASATKLTEGNNAMAYADLDSNEHFSGGDVTADATSPGHFDRVYDNTADPQASTDQEKAAVTQMFYTVNWLHDFWYDSGFDEPAGVAQASNLGRGGVEGDVFFAEGQDSSGTDNANMDTPDDGTSPTMQMFVFDPDPTTHVRRDGTIDNMVIEHEYGHYLHHRNTNCASHVCGVMSEGNADFTALMITVRPTDDLHGTYAEGTYVSASLTQNAAYFGIRRYPYSVELAHDPLTFHNMAEKVPLPAGVPVNDLFSSPHYEVHAGGEVWCSMLWEGAVAILDESKGANPRFTFEEARRRMADYYVGGLKAAPVEPSFTEQRDAILAVAAAADPIDGQLLAEAYARRGFGLAAVSPPDSSGTGNEIVEAFAAAGRIEIDAVTIEEGAGSCDDDGYLDVGETGAIAVTVRNTGVAPLAQAKLTIASTTPGISFPAATTVSFPPIAAGATATARVTVRVDETVVSPTTMSAAVSVTDPTAITVDRTSGLPINRDAGPAGALDDVEAATTAWTVDGTRWARVDSPAATSRVWALPDPNVVADERLVSPAVTVAAGASLTISFRHRFHLDASTYSAITYDGGVLEISDDGGASWQDVGALAAIDYSGTIAAGTDNPLAGRSAWVGASAGYPKLAQVSADLGTGFAGKTVRFRFRFGSNGSWSDAGWEIDDIALGGITSAPFATTEVETGSCLPGARPIANAGTDQSLEGGVAVALDGSASSDPDGTALAYTWTQTSGFHVDLADATVAKPTFNAPVVTHVRLLTFQLSVRDGDNRVSLPDTVTVTLLPAPTPPDAGAPDAAVETVDASTIPPDAGGDAGHGVENAGGGCGCGTSRPVTGDALIVVGLALWLRRRRRAPRQGPPSS